MNYHLCIEGWRLYFLWSTALDAKDESAGKWKREYDKHRRTCAECDKPMKEKQDDRNHQPE